MRFYTKQHPYYCGIDLHTRKMYVCILDQAGQVLVHRHLQTRGDHFLNLIGPYRDGLVVGVECMFSWYWLADLCEKEEIEMVGLDLTLIGQLDAHLNDVELYLERTVKLDDPQNVFLLRESPEARSFVARKEKKHGKAKALSILAARLGRAVYWMLKKQEAFDLKTFFNN